MGLSVRFRLVCTHLTEEERAGYLYHIQPKGCTVCIARTSDMSALHSRKIIFSHFSTETYVMGTQKNRLSEMALSSTQNIC